MTFLLALKVNPHVDPSHLFQGFGGTLEEMGMFLGTWGFTKQVTLYLLAGVLTALLFFWRSRRVREEHVPRGFGNFLEVVMLFIRDDVVRPFLGKDGDKFLPLIWTFFFFILIANLLGLVPFFDYLGHGGNTSTGDIQLTASLAICSFFIYHGIGVRQQGFFHYVKNQFPRVPLFILPIIVPVEILAHIVRPCALAIRLFANMLAGHVMLATIIGFTSVWVSWIHVGAGVSLICFLGCVALSFLELLVAVIQAFVFAFLTTVFLAGAVHPEH